MSTHESQKEAFLDEFRGAVTNTREATGNGNHHSDAASIRDWFPDRASHHNGPSTTGVPRYDSEKFDYPNLVPNIIEKTWDPGPSQFAGGTDLLATGKPGSGKSTLANHLAMRELEVNRSKVVWRASTARSEWLPLAPWATLALPAGISYEAVFEPRNPTESSFTLSLDELEGNVVRDIKRYDSPKDLNQNILSPGQIHVVYPDPLMRGVQDIYEAADDKQYDAPAGRTLFHREDPSTHWWFGWILSRIEYGPFDWTTLILDEIGDIAPEDARKDSFGTYQKIELLKDTWVDARKKGLSIFSFGHAERDIHNMIRHKIRWRMTMGGNSNPTSKSDVVGFGQVPLDWDITSDMDVGSGLVFNESNFEKISWHDYPAAVDHKLKLERMGSA
ncbi:MAG: ATP-binding protein [Halovenus sp.]